MKTLLYSFLLFTLFSACNNTKTASFNLNNFPSDWIMLTEKDGNLIVYNTCDAGNLELSIIQKKEKTELLLHGQQEDSNFDVLESIEVNDTISFKVNRLEGEENQIFKFVWIEKEKGVGRWINTYSNGYTANYLFVSKDHLSNFDQVNQPCKECWGDECDELEEN